MCIRDRAITSLATNKTKVFFNWPIVVRTQIWVPAGSPEQGFRRCFADGVNQSFISSARRLICFWHKNLTRVSKKQNIHSIIELIHPGHLALSNPNIDVKLLAQAYCVAIVSLSFLWTWYWTKSNTLSFVNQANKNQMNWMILLLFANLYSGILK